MFRINDLLAGQSTDIRGSEDDIVPALTSDGKTLKTWDSSAYKYGRVVDKFTKNYVDYVIVMFNHPDDPPSNYVRYLYLAPE